MKSKTYARFDAGFAEKKSFKIKDMAIGLQALDEQFAPPGDIPGGRRSPSNGGAVCDSHRA